jgi:large subunit ribosomal protein L23
VKDPHTILIRPHITEKSIRQSYGDPRIKDDKALVRKYAFIVANDSNKIEIKSAIEAIFNAGKKTKDIQVTSVRTVRIPGKSRRVGNRKPGKKPDLKKAIVTLAPGQMIEDYGV